MSWIASWLGLKRDKASQQDLIKRKNEESGEWVLLEAKPLVRTFGENFTDGKIRLVSLFDPTINMQNLNAIPTETCSDMMVDSSNTPPPPPPPSVSPPAPSIHPFVSKRKPSRPLPQNPAVFLMQAERERLQQSIRLQNRKVIRHAACRSSIVHSLRDRHPCPVPIHSKM